MKTKNFTKHSYNALDFPNFLETQRVSYRWFWEKGLRELLDEISPITDYGEKDFELWFQDYKLDEPKYAEFTARERNTSYEAALRVKTTLLNKSTGEAKEQEVYLGDFPLMTKRGTYVVNGVERIVISQLVRSPGAFFTSAWHVGKQRIQCVRCHATSLHKFVPPSDVCKECHKHETLEGTGMDQHCTSCHAFKAINRDTLRPAREDCLECHQEMQVGVEIFPENIEGGEAAPMAWKCGKCHKPHTKLKLDMADCKACHEEKIGDSELHAVEDHAECTNCHKPHLWRPDVPKTCTEDCHSDKDESHTEGNDCTDCHE